MPKKGENIYKRKDGRWEGRFLTESMGEKKYISVYGHSYKEVKQKLIERRTDSHAASFISFGRAANEWLTDVKPRVKESTYINYEYLLKRQILPQFSGKDMRKLDTGEMNRFIREKSENGRLKGKGGISKKYLRDIVAIVKSVANFCEQEYEIPNKIRNVKTPKVERREGKMLSPAEQQRLTKCLMSRVSTVNLGILLALYTGLRIGEVCGLRWEDYDSAEGTITVRRTVQRIPDNSGRTRLHVGTPKTQSSLRTIPLPLPLIRLLNKLKADNNSFIITGTEAVPEPSRLRSAFKRTLKEYGLRDIRFHDLRHLFASNCIRMNFDVKSLSEILGHANASMTLNRYVHTTLDTKRQYMNLIKI